ncbi:sporulation protein [Bacillus sp. DNRA2]|uniref:sporulation protein n=1 Tax=Bacillus sp. DNRA2 TaxID=2723053 RepID=UPI00145DCBB4|nr:sporulation protein [Bacillus sp. DNRA2]NMD70003.1 sporulation protein [Bacillus sp. DNRA2]
MSLFNKVFASIGIGAATVDTKLERDTLVPGEAVKGIVEVRGGSVEQQIDAIYLSLFTTYLKESDDRKYTVNALIEQVRLNEPFVIKSQETKQIPFSFELPIDTPISLGRSKIWVQTGLDIKNAVDPTDKDFIKVIPNPLTEAVINVVNDLGFRLREVECEEAPYRIRKRLPFVQEFEFVPITGTYRGKLDELEIVFFPSSSSMTDIYMQVDRKARGLGGFLAEALEMDESHIHFTVSSGDLPSLREKINSVIQKFSL